jgi:hypothetical protein
MSDNVQVMDLLAASLAIVNRVLEQLDEMVYEVEDPDDPEEDEPEVEEPVLLRAVGGSINAK